MQFRLFFVPLCLSPAPAIAQQFEDLNALDARIQTVMGDQADKIPPLDRRLRLQRCNEAVSIGPVQDGALILRCSSVGWRIRVPIASGDTVPGRVEAAQLMVRKGEPVEMDMHADGFAIASTGTALDDGALGAAVRVKSSTSDTIVLASVTGRGSVAVAP